MTWNSETDTRGIPPIPVAGRLERLKVFDRNMARTVACELLTSHSCVFQIEPLPDGEYAIITKAEGILAQVLHELDDDRNDRYVIEVI